MPPSSSLTVSSIHSLERLILSDRQHSNELLKLLDFICSKETNEQKSISEALQATHRCFVHFSLSSFTLSPPSSSSSALDRLSVWLVKNFHRFVDSLFSFLSYPNPAIALVALRSLFHWISFECSQTLASSSSIASSTEISHYFLSSSHLFSRLLRLFLSMPNELYNDTIHMELFGPFIGGCDDLRYYALKLFVEFCEQQKVSSSSELRIDHGNFSLNGLKFLQEFSHLRSKFTSQLHLSSVIQLNFLPEDQYFSKYHRLLSTAWFHYLTLNHSIGQMKAILSIMNETIFPVVSSPLLLADFLSDSFQQGGVLSVLSLDSLFTLISKYNLDYPQFYKRLYSLLDSKLYYMKYRVRFFHLLTKCLTSSYLPVMMVASFVKRLARLSLSIPPNGICFNLTVIFNLLRKHTALKTLIHREFEAAQREKQAGIQLTEFLAKRKRELEQEAEQQEKGEQEKQEEVQEQKTKKRSKKQKKNEEEKEEQTEQEKKEETISESLVTNENGADPFLETENDPLKTRAAESSLWELATLKNHYCPSVAQLAVLFEAENAPKRSLEVEPVIVQTSERLFTAELDRRKNQKTHLAYEKPETFAGTWKII
jgi:U3 small nucleolar RNA-associated protein 19